MFKKLWKSISMMQHKKARLFLLLSIVLFNIVLWFITSTLAYLIRPEIYANYLDAILNAGITWMLDPGSYDQTAPLSIRIITLATIIISMVTFTGGIIAYVADVLSSFVNRSEEGFRKIYVYNHILILNWNIKALELIADYASGEDAADIVVVSDYDRKFVEELVDNRLYEGNKASKKQRKINVIVVKGNVFSKQVLDKVCLTKAKSVVILSESAVSADGHSNHADINALKTLMLVTRLSANPKQTIIVEVTSDKTRQLIESQIVMGQEAKDRIIPLLSDELMGKLIAQILIYPALIEVYSQLMVTDGVEFYPVRIGNPMDYCLTHDRCVPVYQSEKHLYVLAQSRSAINHKRDNPITGIPEVHIVPQTVKRTISLVIFGKNNKLRFILDSIRQSEADCNITVKITLIESDDIDEIKESLSGMKHVDTLLLLSDEQLSKDELDSKVLITLLLIQDMEKLASASIIVELLDPRHLDIAKSYRIQHTLISNRYVSHMMAHISKNRDLFKIYDDLLTYDEPGSTAPSKELYSYVACCLFTDPFPLSFSSKAAFIASVCQSSKAAYLVIGMISDGQLELFSDHLEDGPFIVKAEDIVIVVSD